MKRKYAIVGLLIALSVMISTLVSVQATEHYLGPVIVKKDGEVWEISTRDILGNKLFDGKDVYPTSIVAKYWFETNGELIYETILPIQIKLTTNKITLIFDYDDLPEEETDGTVVTGELLDHTTFEATGPGFARRRYR